MPERKIPKRRIIKKKTEPLPPRRPSDEDHDYPEPVDVPIDPLSLAGGKCKCGHDLASHLTFVVDSDLSWRSKRVKVCNGNGWAEVLTLTSQTGYRPKCSCDNYVPDYVPQVTVTTTPPTVDRYEIYVHGSSTPVYVNQAQIENIEADVLSVLHRRLYPGSS